MANPEPDYSTNLNLSADFEMPTAREIEMELALGSESWQSLLTVDKPLARVPQPVVDPPKRTRKPFLRTAKA
jgi:hypothetical protein